MEEPRTAGIILAAGASERFGRPKQLARFRGRPLLAWVIDAALQSDLERVIVVLGHACDRILAQLGGRLRGPRICTLVNHSYRLGQSSSLRLGLAMVRADCRAAMFLLADQPLAESAVLNRLIAAFCQSPKPICVPVSGGRRGNPAIFGREYFGALMGVQGDQGGRELMRNNPDDVLEVDIENPHALADIDTPEDLAKLNALKY